MSYEGSCHCGAVAFTVAAESPADAIACNCSHCRRKGFLLAFVPANSFSLDRGEDVLQSYFFNTHQIEHLFCKTCGTEAFAQGKTPDGSTVRAINLRCVPAIDPDQLTLTRIDGAAK